MENISLYEEWEKVESELETHIQLPFISLGNDAVIIVPPVPVIPDSSSV